ncbi:MAG TPA: hypothetical protein VLE97_06490 [Gaiellaceae bacterium]|nr:hypothetical protein [Gaiellaceae bacterium]
MKTVKNKPKKHQRYVQISVVVPASVKLLVGTDDDDPDENTEWEILSVRDVHCEPTPQLVSESMDETDFGALTEAASKAKDIE